MQDIPALVTDALYKHYQHTFKQHGASPQGVDWKDQQSLNLRYEKLLQVIESKPQHATVSLLDVGCGYGGLLAYIINAKMHIDYTGIDIVPEMIQYATSKFKNSNHLATHTFINQNIFRLPTDKTFDYVICNGICTQQINISIPEMDQFSYSLLKKMFALAKYGIATNFITPKVNFMHKNVYYKNFYELINFCQTELSTLFKIDHSYPLYEYMIYVYHKLSI